MDSDSALTDAFVKSLFCLSHSFRLDFSYLFNNKIIQALNNLIVLYGSSLAVFNFFSTLFVINPL